jgi:Rnl2 family RNA ligase
MQSSPSRIQGFYQVFPFYHANEQALLTLLCFETPPLKKSEKHDKTEKKGAESMEQTNAWHFISYEKIVETPEQWQLDEAGFRQLEKATWVVTEKIHGANFCFITDGRTVTCANRKLLLGPQDDFFHYQMVAERLQGRVLTLFSHLCQRYPGVARIYVYGELFGGCYPHPQVAANPALQPIQTGIYYSPEIEFCAFDLALENVSAGEGRRYIDYAEAIQLFQVVNLLYAAPLFVGSYQEALNYPVSFQSTLPSLLGLPILPEDNRAEGIVTKSYHNLLVSSKKGLIRPVLKKKIPEFAEDKRFAQAQKWSVPQYNQPQEQTHLELLQWEAFNLVTENRLQSAISKLGPVTHVRPGKARQLFKLVVEDILEQLNESQGKLLAALADHERVILQNYIHEEVRKLFKHALPRRKRVR